MKTSINLSAGESHSFNAGQAGRYVIIREASQSVILKGDNLRPVELERGDVVDVSQFIELAFFNHNDSSVHIEYQVSDVEVRIRTASTSINGAPDINEILTPVTVGRIQERVQTQAQQTQDFVTPEHITLEAHEKKKLCEYSSKRLEVLIQNISSYEAEAMVGNSQVSPTVGLPVLGDRKAPAGLTLTGNGEVWAYNNSDYRMTLAVMEMHL